MGWPNISDRTGNSRCTVSGEIIDIGQNLTLSQMPSDVKAIVEAGTSYRILSHQLQLPQNVLAILPEPCGNPTVADPIAMQLMTELEAPDEGQTQFQKSQPAIDTAMAEDIQIPTCSKYLNEEIKSSPNDNITDENLSPNKPAKRINDPGYQQSSKKQATSLLKFRTFEINWNKLGDNLLERLGDLQEFISQNPESAVPRSIRFKKTEMTSLVNNIVDQMRCVDNNIRADTTETVAKQILGKYPCLEILDDDGFSNGLSHITIKHKLINRNTYLNRLNNQANTTTLTPVAKNKRAGTNQEYWKATTNHCTKEVMAKLRRDEPTLLTDEFLVESQGFVRSRMDQKRDLALIMSEFPVFRRRRLLNHHFKEATGTDIEMLRKYFNSKKSKIILYSTTQKLNKLSEKPSDRDVFYFLAKLLDETLDDLILKKEIGTRIDEIRDEAAAPVLIAIDIGNGADMYYVFADRTRLSEGTTDFVCAIQDLMSVHYVHSFMYLKSAAKFLELVQEYFLKIFTTKGSKSSAVRIGKQQRTVKKVIASLSQYESPKQKEPPLDQI